MAKADVQAVKQLYLQSQSLMSRLDSNPKVPKTASDVTRKLELLLALLKKPEVSAEDLLVTRTSNKVCEVINRVRSTNTNRALTNSLSEEIEKRKHELGSKFEDVIHSESEHNKEGDKSAQGEPR